MQRFIAVEGYGQICMGSTVGNLAGVRIDAAGQVHGQHKGTALVQMAYQSAGSKAGRPQFTMESGAVEGIHNGSMAICDTKDTGTDYNFLGVFYQYGDRYYLEDLVFKNIDPGTLDELNSDMLVKHHVQQAQFESNKEGSRTANEVERLVKAKGGRCHITKKYTTQNKETKIIVNSSWVKEHVIFKDITEYEPKSDYGVMMSFLCSYTQLGKNKHDDAPDTLAMFAQFVDALLGGEGQVVKRSDLGI